MLQASFAALALALAASAVAVDKGNKTQSMRDLVNAVLEQLQIVEETAYYIESTVSRETTVSDAKGTDMFGGSNSTYRDMQRAAEEIVSLGNEVSRMAAKCDKEAKKVAAEFRATTRRLRGDVNRIGSSSSGSFMSMTVARVRTDAKDVRGGLGTLGELEVCSNIEDGADDDAQDDKDEKKDDDKPKDG